MLALKIKKLLDAISRSKSFNAFCIGVAEHTPLIAIFIRFEQIYMKVFSCHFFVMIRRFLINANLRYFTDSFANNKVIRD